MENKRIIVCANCGLLYDLHYVEEIRRSSGKNNSITHFKCKFCGWISITYKNLDHFKNN